ncbi:MAG: hypothetical protein GY754_14605 [bacterium]|nr:hypothetical protein [bacterium]
MIQDRINTVFFEIKGQIRKGGLITCFCIFLPLTFLYLLIVPFMLVTLQTPMPMNEDTFFITNMYTGTNIFHFIIGMLGFVLTRRSAKRRIAEFGASAEKMPDEEFKSELLKVFKKVNNMKLFTILILSGISFYSFLASFVQVTGPLVLSRPEYYLNFIPVVMQFIYFFMVIPTNNNAKAFIVKRV